MLKSVRLVVATLALVVSASARARPEYGHWLMGHDGGVADQ